MIHAVSLVIVVKEEAKREREIQFVYIQMEGGREGGKYMFKLSVYLSSPHIHNALNYTFVYVHWQYN